MMIHHFKAWTCCFRMHIYLGILLSVDVQFQTNAANIALPLNVGTFYQLLDSNIDIDIKYNLAYYLFTSQ